MLLALTWCHCTPDDPPTRHCKTRISTEHQLDNVACAGYIGRQGGAKTLVSDQNVAPGRPYIGREPFHQSSLFLFHQNKNFDVKVNILELLNVIINGREPSTRIFVSVSSEQEQELGKGNFNFWQAHYI